jgi:hypothetical protein
MPKIQAVFSIRDIRPIMKHRIKMLNKPEVQEMLLRTQRWNKGLERVQDFMVCAQKEEQKNDDFVRTVTEEIQSVRDDMLYSLRNR